ncbi:MAG: hypothetical protein ACP5LT_00910 [Candidatus Kapaibacteriota bacterium]
MKKFALVLSLLLTIITSKGFSLLPIVSVPELPKNLRNFVTDERKYFELLVDYYVRAKLLEAQLDTSGLVPLLGYDAIVNQDLQELKRFANLSKELYNKVLGLPEERRITNLRKQVDKLLWENRMLKIENDSLRVESEFKALVDLKDSLIRSLSMKLIDCEYNNDFELYSQLERTKYQSLMSFGVSAVQMFYDNLNLTSYLAPSFDLSLRLLSIDNGSAYLNFETSYIYLTNLVKFPEIENQVQFKYKDDIWNFNVSIAFNLSKILNANSFYWQLGIGSGYMLAFSKEQVPFGFQNDYKGYSIIIYTILGGFSKRVPIGIVIGGKLFKYLDELRYNSLSLGKPFVPGFYLGLKFNILNSF